MCKFLSNVAGETSEEACEGSCRCKQARQKEGATAPVAGRAARDLWDSGHPLCSHPMVRGNIMNQQGTCVLVTKISSWRFSQPYHLVLSQLRKLCMLVYRNAIIILLTHFSSLTGLGA